MTDKTKSELAAEERELVTSHIQIAEEDKEDVSKEEVEDKTDDEEDEVKEDNEDEEKEVETKDEEKEEEDKPSVEKLLKTIERLQRRIDKKTGNERQLQNEMRELRQQLAAKEAETGTLTEEDVKARAKEIADVELNNREFAKACEKLEADALKIDKKFSEKIQELASDIGDIPSHLIGMLDDLDNGGEILAHLANNIDEAEDIWKIKSWAKQSLALTKLSLKLETEAKAKKIKKISNAPEVKEGVKGGTKSPVVLHDKMSDAEWIENRNKQVAERRAAKMGGMR